MSERLRVGEKARIDEADDDGEADDRDREQRLLRGEAPEAPVRARRRACDRRRAHAAFSTLALLAHHRRADRLGGRAARGRTRPRAAPRA